jgi:hypothetical protein
MAPKSALHDIRRICGADGTESPERRCTLRERYERERDAVLEWARSSLCLLDAREYLNRVQGGGAEHAVFLDGDVVTKITRRFGLTVGTNFHIGKRTQRYLGVPFVRQATPLEYLERLALFNELFGDDIRVAGVLAGPEPAIVTTQPVIRGRDAAPDEITAFMGTLGFAEVPYVVAGRRDSASFFRAADSAAAFDAHGENVIAGTAGVAPIDLFVVRADEDLAAFLAMPPDERLAEFGEWVSLSSP